MPANWRLEHPLAATTKTALQGRGTVHRKNASQLVHGTGTGSFIWKLPILASQIRKRRAGPASGMRWALIVLVMCENEKVKGGDTPFTSFSCDASARPLTFNALDPAHCWQGWHRKILSIMQNLLRTCPRLLFAEGSKGVLDRRAKSAPVCHAPCAPAIIGDVLN